MNIPSEYNTKPIIGENEQIFRIDVQSVTKDIIITMPTEVNLSGLSIHPEPLKFEQVHSTIIRCHEKCTKQKHCITYLKNDPGYLMVFKMYVRSSMTNGKWILLGTFIGNNSIYDVHRVSFDIIPVKQIKIEPVSYHSSFDKVKLFPIGPSINTTTKSDE